MRYGMNSHQSARVVSEHNPLRALDGEPSLSNYPDFLNAWPLVRSVSAPIAAPSWHLSHAGVLASCSNFSQLCIPTKRPDLGMEAVVEGVKGCVFGLFR